MGFDPYFTSAVDEKSQKVYSQRHDARWKAFNMMSHQDQAKAIDKLLAKKKRQKLNAAEYAILRRWEIGHQAPLPV